jgi:hypothetical protein
MRTARPLAALVIAAAALTACGGPGPAASPAVSTAAAPPAAAAVAAQLGATAVQPLNPPTLYAYSEVTATLHGRAVDIATFRTNQLRDQWVKAAGQFTGIEQTGNLYAVADG